ncbi:sensor histidine kinase [Kitasatospora sp. NPDC059747]|uniref:sensor histidine kinase n=1 Tax=Kitasatospora sp. NPDC059747 TaxID=3346930 RepID=UPI003667F1F6
MRPSTGRIRPHRLPTRLRSLRPRTLRGRLALIALVSIAVWVAVLTAVFQGLLTAQLNSQTDELLRTRATAAAATVRPSADGRLTIDEPADDSALDVGVWIYQDDQALERPTASRALQNTADRLAGGPAGFSRSTGPDPARLYVLPVLAGDRRVGAVVAAVGPDPGEPTAELALTAAAALAALMLAAVYLVTRAVVGGALRPVAAMSAQAAAWSAADTTRRFGTARRPAELSALAGNLDELLDRLAAVLRHEQQLTAELSHELRTPLARITAETDWLLARPRDAAEQQAAHRAIAESSARMREICETLLSQARDGIGAGGGTGEAPGRCLLAPLLATLAERSAQEFPHAPPVRVHGGDAQVVAGVSAPIVERILAPLLDNARRYARTSVTMECAGRPGSVTVVVSDDGPGIPEGVGEAVFEPGRRADPGDGHDGAGLGLALARRLARAAGGDLTLGRPSAGAGGCFELSLPTG